MYLWKKVTSCEELKRSVTYKFNKKNLHKYFDTNTFDYDDYNKACEYLERESLISIQWKENIPGHTNR